MGPTGEINRAQLGQGQDRFIKYANQTLITFPQLICSTAVSRKKKYILSLMSKEPTKLGSESEQISLKNRFYKVMVLIRIYI